MIHFDEIHKEFIINGQIIKNRIFFAPMGIDMGNTDGTFSNELYEFYTGIIKGGCGFLILSNATVSEESILQPNGLRLYNKNQSDSLRDIIKYANKSNAICGVQLQHYGGQGVTTYTQGKPLLTPSGVKSKSLQKKDSRYKVKIIDQKDIIEIKNQFVNSAILAVEAGAKLIQLQASNGYLLSSFQSPSTNFRIDQYGGSVINRGRLLKEIIEQIRLAVPTNIILSARINADDMLGELGTTANDFEKLIPIYEEAGLNMIEVSVCVAETFSMFSTNQVGIKAHLIETVKKIKSYSNISVGFAGLVGDLQQIEDILTNEIADYVGMARALFADNDLIYKTLNGKENLINKCLWDGKCFLDKYNPRYQRVYCCVNPKYKRPD